MRIHQSDADFLTQQLNDLTVERITLTVSEWAEQNRYLPSELTPRPGPWDNSVCPHLIEIMNSLGPQSSARKIVVMKAAQVMATTGLVENFLGYIMAHQPGGTLYASADADSIKRAMELKVDAMLQHSGLRHLLGARNSTTRKGDSALRKEFPGGFIQGVGARNPAKLRELAAKYLLIDECDGFPRSVGDTGREEGSPLELLEKRTDSYQHQRKILYVSSPLKARTSLIAPLFYAGDQRHYEIPCPHCGYYQRLEWHGMAPAGHKYGITFDTDKSGNLVADSVGYACIECAAVFYNHDKSKFLPLGKWRAHSETEEEGLISFHLPAFISPPGFYDWTGSVRKWFKAWDVKNDRVRDLEKLQAFYNLERGLPWEERGESPKAEKVRENRRDVPTYVDGVIPNSLALKETGAPIVLLTCAVDVHGDRLDAEVVGWCKDRQTYSILWTHLEGDPDTQEPWMALDKLISQSWVADDGRQYVIQVTLIDAGWGEKSDAVYQFCQDYSSGVYPIMGRRTAPKGALVKEFQQSVSAVGNVLFNITAGIYKDRLASLLRVQWDDSTKIQPTGMLNFPSDRGEDYFREWEGEEKVQRVNAKTRQIEGHEWRQISSRPNHAWDCFDSATEALTRDGWKPWPDVTMEDELLTVALHSWKYEYQQPMKLINNNHDGDMIQIRGYKTDILVTPGHRMLVTHRQRNGGNVPHFVRADELTRYHRIALAAEWEGVDCETVHVPSSSVHHTPIDVNSEDMAAFLGFWIAEGHRRRNFSQTQNSWRHLVIVDQKDGWKADLVQMLLSRLPWHFKRRTDEDGMSRWVCTSKQLYHALDDCGDKAHGKRVPQWVRDASPRVIDMFVSWAVLGDGYVNPDGAHRKYYTVSRELADGMQELFLKIGHASNIREVQPPAWEIAGRTGPSRLQYHVSDNTSGWASLRRMKGTQDESIVERVHYKGRVYCATVPNGTLIVRRNGRQFIAGNCRVYAMAAMDMVVHEHCTEVLGLAKMDYEAFFAYATPRRDKFGAWVESPFSVVGGS